MLSQCPSLLRATVLTTAVLVLGLGMERNARAQEPVPTGQAGGYREGGPAAPKAGQSGSTGQSASTGGMGTTSPVFWPGYFEVVCPAICYGGAFHVCGVRAFGGAGYYGPFRRYWGYSTYGPNYNIGPDNSIQYGLQGGVMYEATHSCKGLYKHGGDCACGHCPLCAKGGSQAASYGPIAQLSLLQGASQQPTTIPGGASQQPTEKLLQPTPNTAPQPPEKLSPPTGNSAHLRLLVPENAEVLVEGSKTTTTGTIRDFVSPPLNPGKNMTYSILVRYTDAGGKVIEEAHSVRVRANDRLNLDCTKPATAEQPRVTVQRP